jgi:hypothetical protein
MSKCLKWGNQVLHTCIQWADQGSDQCTKWADEGSDACTQWADHGSNQCKNWWKWLCKAFYWVSKWVCIVTLWISKWVCKATVWVACLVCIVATAVVVAVCWLFEVVVLSFVKTIIFLVLAPFAAAIDAVCQSCTAYDWVKLHFGLHGSIDYISREEIPGSPDQFLYVFLCHCLLKENQQVSVEAGDDEEAAKKAREACSNACG